MAASIASSARQDLLRLRHLCGGLVRSTLILSKNRAGEGLGQRRGKIVLEQVRVGIECDSDRGMPEKGLELFDVAALSDHARCVGVAK